MQMLFFYFVNFLDFLGINFIRLSLVGFDAVFFFFLKKVVFFLLTCSVGCMSRTHREMLTEKNKGNPM
jgi:hypothetical protein